MSKQNFADLVLAAEELGNGTHNVKVAKVIAVGCFANHQPEVAVIKDDQGRLLMIPEDPKCDGNYRLVSRWSLKENMNLLLEVEDGKITDVFIEEQDCCLA